MPEQLMRYTGMWTTDESGRIVFVKFPVPIAEVHDRDCNCGQEDGGA